MPVDDYLSAAFRHARDAGHLLVHGRPDNAAYLAGYTIECGLKILVDAYAPGLVNFSVHELDTLELVALVATIAHVDANRIFPTQPVAAARGCGWTVGWRYSADDTVSAGDAAIMVAAAQRMISDTICGAALDGRVHL